ncbi:ribonuclease R, partial [Klebsiella pneumoniae]|uniref:ribonuclease R n=1 Tax=Klebsiella pneumoniae TaxID=573 RepID=UPI0030F01EC3
GDTPPRAPIRPRPVATHDADAPRACDAAGYSHTTRGGGWRLWVAIADVSYYVRPGTPLDAEARSRGTSVYFPSQVVPMLPEVLSNGLCSLNPQVDRLCMVCEMTISSKGRLTGYKFYEAVMSSHARLTYTKVWHMLQGDQELREHYAPLVKHIEELHNLYNVLESAREERGGISFESEEAKFIFNAERRIERIEQTQRNDAHKLIEECMILANISAARFVEKAQEPALFRIHDKPTTEAITSFRTVLAELGLELPGGNKPEPRDYAELLTSIADRPDAEMLQTMLLRSMKQAVYDPENRGHFGLALQSYAHFTSPIRRYPDLSLHRAIKYLLAKEQGHKGNSTETGGWHYSMEEMLQLGQHCSMTERRADEATREVSDWLKCDFMQDQVGNIFSGVIASVTGFGFFVRLNDLFIDGLVHVSSLDNDYYRFDQVGQRLIGESGGQTYRLGDRVEVRVEAVNMDERKIDFTLISSERAPRNVGKTAREKAKKSTSGKPGGRRRQVGKQVNFEPDSAFRKEKETARPKKEKKAKKPSAKTQKIAAATKAKRAAKKKIAE